ncbi:hypothetical protein ACHHYP_18008 [Achlya hypogyna]|uniref:Uncharacterized protein n=1 Tax=Achlya hypogyna TaxID=1202772 RepID=A0A1V9Z6K0_ACHHY|nr:hypothetical protein ACHHYP_18008 [Achlya hypogyna]
MTANREASPLLPPETRTVQLGSVAPSAPKQAPARPAQEIHPLPWFRSPELSMNKEKARLNLKRKQAALKAPERWTCSRYFSSLGNGEKCVHLLVLVILIFTIIVIVSIMFAPDETTATPPRALRWGA